MNEWHVMCHRAQYSDRVYKWCTNAGLTGRSAWGRLPRRAAEPAREDDAGGRGFAAAVRFRGQCHGVEGRGIRGHDDESVAVFVHLEGPARTRRLDLIVQIPELVDLTRIERR